MTDGRTDERTDGRAEAIAISPTLGDKKQQHIYNTYTVKLQCLELIVVHLLCCGQSLDTRH